MKNNIPTAYTSAYAGAALLVIAGAQYQIDWLYMIFKPLLMLILLAAFRNKVVGGNGLLVTVALVMSLAGDVFLMFDEAQPIFFMGGLAAFLTAHIFYTAFFVNDILRSRPWNQHWFQMALATVLVVYAVEFYILNRQFFGELKLYVLIYITMIAIMGISAVMRDRTRPQAAYAPIMAGALFFITSDSLLAINKFVMELPFASAGILFLYATAQYLIISGIISVYEHRKSLDQNVA